MRKDTKTILFNDLWNLINRLMVVAGGMLWLEDGSSAHEALLDIAEKYAPEVAMELDSRLADGDSGLYFAKDAPASDHQALRDALLNGGSYWTLADIYQSSGDAAYLPKHVMDRHEVVALAEQIAAL